MLDEASGAVLDVLQSVYVFLLVGVQGYCTVIKDWSDQCQGCPLVVQSEAQVLSYQSKAGVGSLGDYTGQLLPEQYHRGSLSNIVDKILALNTVSHMLFLLQGRRC